MVLHDQPHTNKVRLTVECSFDERTYIKMLAAKKNMTISEVLLASVRTSISPKPTCKPNSKTEKALKESREKKLKTYKTLDEFWAAMGIDPDA